MPGQALYGKGGRVNPDLLPNAHKKGFKYDPKMKLWYQPLARKKKKSDDLKIAQRRTRSRSYSATMHFYLFY